MNTRKLAPVAVAAMLALGACSVGGQAPNPQAVEHLEHARAFDAWQSERQAELDTLQAELDRIDEEMDTVDAGYERLDASIDQDSSDAEWDEYYEEHERVTAAMDVLYEERAGVEEEWSAVVEEMEAGALACGELHIGGEATPECLALIQ